MKICSTCKTKYDDVVANFHRNRAQSDGFNCQCKTCRKKYSRDNRDHISEYCKANRSAIYQQMKKYIQTLRGHTVYRTKIIRDRCIRPDRRCFKNYGGRGIKLCFTAKELYDWCVEHNVDPRGKEIHRIDNDGNYTLDNIEFLTKEEHIQAHLEPVPF